MIRYRLTLRIGVLLALAFATAGRADVAAAKRWIDKEFQPSTLSKDQQLKEMEWFINAAKPYRGMEINVLSERTRTPKSNSKYLPKSSRGITGIRFNTSTPGDAWC